MKYSEKHKNIKYLQIIDDIILKGTPAKCVVCGELTDFIDVCYEAYICSDECQSIIDNEFNFACNNMKENNNDY